MGHRKVLPATLAAGVMAAAIAVLAVSATASPQRNSRASAPAVEIQRTFVSTSGSDANPCSRQLPCRNFTAALVNTLPGGEVIALTSGGYGVFTIDKAVTVAGAPGVHVAITAFTGTGIDVNAAPDDTVVLRNLYVTGLGGATGILFEGGQVLHVEDVVIGGFVDNGIEASVADAGLAVSLLVKGSTFRHNGGNGLHVGEALHVEIDGSHADRNDGDGFALEAGARGSIVESGSTGNGGAGYSVDGGARAMLVDSVADDNGADGVSVVGIDTQAMLTDVSLTDNDSAGLAVGSGSPTAQIGGSTVARNDVGLEQSAGTLGSFGDNRVRGNATNTSGTITDIPFTRLAKAGSDGARHWSFYRPERDSASRPAPQAAPAAAPDAPTAIQRTFVATTGSDANPCTAAAPCRNFAAAMAQTLSGGEVVALDSGGYGPVVVDKAVTIAGTPGQHVAVTAFSGTAIEVSPPDGAVVILRNLYLTGIGGETGIDFESGAALHVENVTAAGFAGDGLDAFVSDASLTIRNSTFRGNSAGMFIDGTNLQVDIANTHVDQNDGDGIFVSGDVTGQIAHTTANNNGFDGFFFDFGAVMTLSDSVADGNATRGVVATSEGTIVMLSGNVLSNGEVGLYVADGAVARTGGTAVFGNVTGLFNDLDSGTLETFGDNLVGGNDAASEGAVTTVGTT